MTRVVHRDGFDFTVTENLPEHDGGGYDFWAGYEGGWEHWLTPVLKRCLAPGTSFVDIGAWIGPVTLLASRLCRHVYCAEPDPVARRELSRNLELNGCENVTTFTGAISVKNGGIQIGRKEEGVWGDSMTSALLTAETKFVWGLTLASFFEMYGIEDCTLIKIDVEGYEGEILCQARDFFIERRIPILVSLHCGYFENGDAFMERVREGLAPFSRFYLESDHEPERRITLRELPRIFANVLAIP